MDCQDQTGYTPLFYATKAGWLPDIIELINHGANINHISNANGKTCLFIARNYDTVLLLLKHGADPTIKSKKDLTAIEHLMKHNSNSAEAILDSCCNKENDNLVMDFSIFKYDKSDVEDEMALFNVVQENEHSERELLLHPLIQIFLNIKYKTIKKAAFLNAMFHLVLAITLTIMAVEYVELTSCEVISNQECSPFSHSLKLDSISLNIMVNDSGNPLSLLSSKLSDENKPSKASEINENNKYEVIICKNEEGTCFNHYGITFCSLNDTHVGEVVDKINQTRRTITPQPIQCVLNTIRMEISDHSFFRTIQELHGISWNYSLSVFCGILWLVLIMKELYELFGRGFKIYFNSMENILELTLVCLSTSFVLDGIYGLFIRVQDFEVVHLFVLHLAAWMVFFAWIDFMLYMGRIEIFGQNIFMSLDVFKTMLKCISTFVPCLIAFSVAFYVLLETNPLTHGYTKTFIRTIGMMVGELNYDYIFEYNVVKRYGGRNYSTQIMYIFFVISMSMVVLNLIIGLTVSKIDELKDQSKLIQTKKKIIDIIAFDIYDNLRRKITGKKDDTILGRFKNEKSMKVL